MVSATPTKAAAAAGASGTSSTPSPARSGSTPKSVRKASKGASPSPASAKKDTLASTPVKTGAARSTSSSSSSSSNKAARTKSPQHTTPSKPAASAATSDALPALAAPAPAVADARREPPLSHPSPVKRDARPTSPSHPLSSTPNSVLSDLPTPTATPSRELGATMATPTAAAAAAAAALSSVAAADGVAASTPASTPEAAATKPEIELGLATTMAIDAAAVPVDESVPDSDETMLVDDAEPVAAAPTAARAVVSDPFQDWSVDELPTAMGFHFGPAPAAAEAEDTATPWALDAADLQDAAPRAVVPQLHPFLTSRVAPVAPLFNHTDELVCFAVGATVKVVSAPTQQVVRTLAPELGAADRVSPIVAMHIDARRRYELWTCAQNGVFRMWDYEEGAVRREWDIARPVRWVVPDHLDGQFVFVVLESEAPAAAIADQLQRDVVTGDAEARSLGALSPVYRMDLQSGQLTYLTHVAAEVAFAVSAGGDFLVAGHPTGCEVLLLGQGSTATATNSSASDAAPDTASAVVTVQARRMFWTPKRLTALTTHDTLACLAAGFEDGHIDLMSCFEGRFFTSDAKSAVPSTRLHWHAQAVTSLQFSPGGPYLHSGGHEATLVVWNIETHAKRFMPRLGTSALFGMGASPQHTMIALIHADSAVHLVKTADFSHVPLTLGFQQGHDTHDRMHPVPATVQHGSLRAHRGVWATEGVPGTLQFMDVFDKTPLDPVVVAPATQVTAAHQTDAAVPQPHIDHVAWSPDGAWMATVDHIRFGATAADRTQATERTHLKFWSRETAASPASASASASSSSPWTQNTKILQPHGAVVSGRHARITGLHFLDAERAVTSAADGTVKFWQCETLVHPSTNDDASKTDIFWRCAQTTGYQKRAATAMALSGDRTLLAIAFGDAVTLWDARGHRLLHVLRMPNASAARAEDTVWSVSQMGFLPHTPFLVASSARGIALWDLQRLAVVWHHALAVTHLVLPDAADADAAGTLAVISVTEASGASRGGATNLYVLSPHLGVPLAVYRLPGRYYHGYWMAPAAAPTALQPALRQIQAAAGHPPLLLVNRHKDVALLTAAHRADTASFESVPVAPPVVAGPAVASTGLAILARAVSVTGETDTTTPAAGDVAEAAAANLPAAPALTRDAAHAELAFLQGPAYMLPAPSLLLQVMLQTQAAQAAAAAAEAAAPTANGGADGTDALVRAYTIGNPSRGAQPEAVYSDMARDAVDAAARRAHGETALSMRLSPAVRERLAALLC